MRKCARFTVYNRYIKRKGETMQKEKLKMKAKHGCV